MNIHQAVDIYTALENSWGVQCLSFIAQICLLKMYTSLLRISLNKQYRVLRLWHE